MSFLRNVKRLKPFCTILSLEKHILLRPLSTSLYRNVHTSGADYVKIYTKTGDKGKTSTFAGDRRVKTDQLFEALGTIDELTSCIGIAREFVANLDPIPAHLQTQLFKIQCVLQDLASCVATPKSRAQPVHLQRTTFSDTHIKTLESWIDQFTLELPELKNFIIPSGGKASGHLHLARAICRRAERRVIPIVEMDEVDNKVLVYLNRLSDYLFTVARVAAKNSGKPEEIYIKQ